MELPIKEINEGGAQIRFSEYEDYISKYAEILKDRGWIFPPVDVVEIGGRYVIADGHHRVKAAQRAGIANVPINVVGTTLEEAEDVAYIQNSEHGKPLTQEEQRAFRRKRILENPDKTASELAQMLKCSHVTILRDMKKLETEGPFKRPETVVHSNGRIVKAKYDRRAKSTCTHVQVKMATCTQCGFKAPIEMLDAPDSTWEKRDFNPQTMKYEAYFCGLDCLAKWESQNAPETPQNAPETPAVSLEGSFTQEEPDAPQEAKNWGLRRYSLDIEVVEGTDDAEIIDLITSAFQFFSRARINNINNINIKKNINNININAESSVKTEFSWELNDGSEYYLPREKYEQYKRCFPGIDLDAELLKCIAWSISNPRNRKTKSGILKHIGNWLSNAQNSARPARVNQNAKSPYQAAHVTFEDIPY